MGYIKFGKTVSTNGGRADLIPCDDVMHVSVPTATGIVLTFGENTSVDTATLVYPTQSDFSTTKSWKYIMLWKPVIGAANGAAGPAFTAPQFQNSAGVNIYINYYRRL